MILYFRETNNTKDQIIKMFRYGKCLLYNTRELVMTSLKSFNQLFIHPTFIESMQKTWHCLNWIVMCRTYINKSFCLQEVHSVVQETNSIKGRSICLKLWKHRRQLLDLVIGWNKKRKEKKKSFWGNLHC